MTKQCALPFVGDSVELPLGEVFLDSVSGTDNIATMALLVAELAVSNMFLVICKDQRTLPTLTPLPSRYIDYGSCGERIGVSLLHQASSSFLP